MVKRRNRTLDVAALAVFVALLIALLNPIQSEATTTVKVYTGALVSKRASCSLQEFNTELATVGPLKGLTVMASDDYSAYIQNVQYSNDYERALRNFYYYTYTSVNPAQADYWKPEIDKAILQYKTYVESNLFCATFSKISDPPEWLMEPYTANIDARLNSYTNFETAYPTKNQKSTIVMIDTILIKQFIHPPHLPRVLAGKSLFLKESLAIKAQTSPIPPATHGNIVQFAEGMVSDANIYPVAIGDSSSRYVSERAVSLAMDYVIANKNAFNLPVLNLSLGSSISGNSTEWNLAINAVHDAGIPVIQAIGNTPSMSLAQTYNPKEITVGFAVDGIIRSSFGVNGPDLLVDASGPGVYPLSNGDVFGVPFSTGKSSFMTGIVSGIVSRMRNTRPLATPDEIKSTLMSTSIKFTGAGASFVRGGYVNPKAALDKLKTFQSCTDNINYDQTPPLGWIRIENNTYNYDVTVYDPSNSVVASFIRENCRRAGGTPTPEAVSFQGTTGTFYRCVGATGISAFFKYTYPDFTYFYTFKRP